jgi:hypothetical protein
MRWFLRGDQYHTAMRRGEPLNELNGEVLFQSPFAPLQKTGMFVILIIVLLRNFFSWILFPRLV